MTCVSRNLGNFSLVVIIPHYLSDVASRSMTDARSDCESAAASESAAAPATALRRSAASDVVAIAVVARASSSRNLLHEFDGRCLSNSLGRSVAVAPLRIRSSFSGIRALEFNFLRADMRFYVVPQDARYV